MISKKIPAYIGLLLVNDSEPAAETGYARIPLGDVAIPDIPGLPFQNQIVFEDVKNPGYGDVAAVALFCKPQDSEPLWVWKLPTPVNVHEGVIPAIVNGQLIRGVEVKAEIYLQSADICGAGN